MAFGVSSRGVKQSFRHCSCQISQDSLGCSKMHYTEIKRSADGFVFTDFVSAHGARTHWAVDGCGSLRLGPLDHTTGICFLVKEDSFAGSFDCHP